ncbi:winged helix-turn-helix transcriptional regulator [Aeromonas rivuli]|uniref:winged helix-turn-helix transcriptional regulator n=1 Tax=Aeromonas rivuli TaxID=648794 RepID=UPI001CCA5509|nr:helix-turn-helix domain-containing protein [Aeromonas rivuli]UBO73009.1 helix-turn-helix transcriptional regulator [Aeromonas rivuli]
MRRKNLSEQQCPIARSLEHVGEWWSLLIIRDAMHGLSRFDEFQKSLGVAPNILTRRLTALVEGGLMEKRCYSERPPRYQYLLTPRGQDLRSVLMALLAWGNTHFAPEGASIQLKDILTGELVEPMLVDRRTGQAISPSRHTLVPGPAASDGMKQRLRHANGVMSGDNPSKQESES